MTLCANACDCIEFKLAVAIIVDHIIFDPLTTSTFGKGGIHKSTIVIVVLVNA